MYKKNMHEYLESQQDPEDIYYIYGQYRKQFIQKENQQAAADYIFASAAALKRELQKALSGK